MSSQSRKYSPMHQDHVPRFPNCMPQVDLQTYLPKFRYGKCDDATLHLIRFHMRVCKLRINFHEYFLMKMFMITLEERAWFWYDKYREAYPSLFLIEDCCDHFENCIQEMESSYGDEEFMDDELLDALNENPHHHDKIMDSTLDDNKLEQNSSKDDNDLPSYEVDSNLQQSFQSSSDQDIYKDVLSIFPSFLSSFEFLIQEEIRAYQNFEFACIETLQSYDLSVEVKNSVQQVFCLECDEHVQQPSIDQDIEFFQSLDNSFSNIHEKPLVDICVDADLDTSIEDMQEHSNLVFYMDSMEDEIVAFPFKKDPQMKKNNQPLYLKACSFLLLIHKR